MSSTLTIQRFAGGPLETNAYLIIDPGTASALLVDTPPETHDAISAAVSDAGIEVRAIILTHAHWDHIVDASALRASLGAPLLAHADADRRLASPGSAVMAIPYTITPVTPDTHLADGDTVTLGDHAFAVLHLPGHDPAHIALYSEADRMMFGGDVLFPGGHGRTDIPGSDQTTMLRSLARLLDLPDDVTVYPGHGLATDIASEREWLARIPDSIAHQATERVNESEES
jgi:glyoxylase-like metal-dependent hydrolase (beta-lactamase superfamily II)